MNELDKILDKIEDYTPEILGICIGAGELIKEVYNRDFDVNIKSDKTPVTEADLKASELIVRQLTKVFEYPVISEENCKDYPYDVRKDFECYWCIDPLDGTREFINKTDQFSVNISLIYKNKPVFGMIYAPILNVVYYAFKGKGAFKVENLNLKLNFREKITTRKKSKDEPYKILASRSYRDNTYISSVLSELKKHNNVIVDFMGSSLKMCLIAEGKAHLYPRIGATSEWDTAAAEVILIESGAHILSIPHNKPLEYNKKREDFGNPYFFACSDILPEYFEKKYVPKCRLEK